MPMRKSVHTSVVAACLLCSFSPALAATQISFHPGQSLQGLTLDGQGEGASQLVATWDKGLATIDAATLAVSDLDSGYSLNRVAAAPGAFFYYKKQLVYSSAQLKSVSGQSTAVLAPDLYLGQTRTAGERLLFLTGSATDLRMSDGSPEGTFLLSGDYMGNIQCGIILCEPLSWPPQFFGTPEGKLFYWLAEGGTGYSYALWTRDAPAAYPGLPPQPVPATRKIYESDYPEDFFGVSVTSGGRLLYFAGNPWGVGFNLYSSDGSEGERLELLRGLGWEMTLLPASAEIGGITYFILRKGNERELWRTDGLTPTGTYRIRELGQSEEIYDLWPVGGKLFFALDTPATGSELWVSDGTAAGTHLLVEGRPGPAGGDPRDITALPDGRIVFGLTDEEHGREPWISDGTAAGTHLLEEVWPGSGGSSPSSFVPSPATGRLFFLSRAVGGVAPTYLPFDFGPPPCPDDKLCLRDGRFEVSISWTAGGQSGQAQRASASEEAGLFSFFSPGNWEVMVKVLDGCALNQHFWVFAAATDVHFEITVKDTATGATRTYVNAGGTPAPATTDIEAFTTCQTP